MLRRVFLLIKRMFYVSNPWFFLIIALTRTNIPFLVSKRGGPTFYDVGNFLNINLKTHARTNLDILISLLGKKEVRTVIRLLH
jgi:hypothetical protein